MTATHEATLLLLPGDPLPPLRVTPPLSLSTFAGRWLLLLSARDLGPARDVAAALAGVAAVRLLRTGPETPQAPEPLDDGDFAVHGDPAGQGADALGAFEQRPRTPDAAAGGPAAGRRPHVAALVDPRGTVQLSVVWHSADELCTAVRTCLGRGARR